MLLPLKGDYGYIHGITGQEHRPEGETNMEATTYTGNKILLAKIEGSRFYRLYVDGEQKPVLVDGYMLEGNVTCTVGHRMASPNKEVINIPAHSTTQNHNNGEIGGGVRGDTIHTDFNEYDHMYDLEGDNEYGWHFYKPVLEVEVPNPLEKPEDPSTSETEDVLDDEPDHYANIVIRQTGYKEKDHSDTPENYPSGEKPVNPR